MLQRTGLHTNGQVRTGHTVAAHDAGHGAALGNIAHVAHDLHFRQGQERLLRAVDPGCAWRVHEATKQHHRFTNKCVSPSAENAAERSQERPQHTPSLFVSFLATQTHSTRALHRRHHLPNVAGTCARGCVPHQNTLALGDQGLEASHAQRTLQAARAHKWEARRVQSAPVEQPNLSSPTSPTGAAPTSPAH